MCQLLCRFQEELLAFSEIIKSADKAHPKAVILFLFRFSGFVRTLHNPGRIAVVDLYFEFGLAPRFDQRVPVQDHISVIGTLAHYLSGFSQADSLAAPLIQDPKPFLPSVSGAFHQFVADHVLPDHQDQIPDTVQAQPDGRRHVKGDHRVIAALRNSLQDRAVIQEDSRLFRQETRCMLRLLHLHIGTQSVWLKRRFFIGAAELGALFPGQKSGQFQKPQLSPGRFFLRNDPGGIE